MKIKLFRKNQIIDGLTASKGCGMWTDVDGTIRITDGQFSNGCINIYRQKDDQWISEWKVKYPVELNGIFLLRFDFYQGWNIREHRKLIKQAVKDLYEDDTVLHSDSEEIVLYHTDKYGTVAILNQVVNMPGVYTVKTDSQDDCGMAIITEEDYERLSKRSFRLELIKAQIG